MDALEDAALRKENVEDDRRMCKGALAMRIGSQPRRAAIREFGDGGVGASDWGSFGSEERCLRVK